MPAVDAWETEDEVVYQFDLPGIPEDKISVEYEDGSSTVSGERERTQEVSEDRLYRFERRFGSFSRTFGVPQVVGEAAIKANYRDGVLEVRVRKPRRIQVGAGEEATIEGKSKEPPLPTGRFEGGPKVPPSSLQGLTPLRRPLVARFGEQRRRAAFFFTGSDPVRTRSRSPRRRAAYAGA
jgi:HSP20 family protein